MRYAHKSLVCRLHRQRRADAGLTLIELLISLVLLALITGFLAGGITVGRRSFAADQTAAAEAANAAALDSLLDLIASALPTKTGQGAQIAFEGGRETLGFVGLSAGHALPGGPLGFRIYRQGAEIEVAVKLSAPAAKPKTQMRTTAVRGVASLELRYFGSSAPGQPPAWHPEWPASDHLPDLVAVKVSFRDRNLTRPALVVALRQS